MAKLNRIKIVLAEKDLNNKWLAEKIGKDPATVSKWVTNTTQPSLEALIAIVNAMEVPVLREFNLHTIIRLPGSIFAPYTSIATNILFFNNEQCDGAEEGFSTKDTWFYLMDMPEGYKHFSKTKPMKAEHCKPIIDWWNDRKEIVSEEGGEKSRCFTAQQLLDMDCNFDQCKFPKEEEILPPAELLKQYFEKRAALDHEIDKTLSEIQKILGIDIKSCN
jgi:Type I restriction-modification system methyltransferase subunit